MTGIVAYVGQRHVSDVLLSGFRQIGYGGYDSCGIAIVNGEPTKIVRATGSVSQLEVKLKEIEPIGHGAACGIGHARWVTHARQPEEHAPPYLDCTGQLVIIHVGLIKNILELKYRLVSEGHDFRTNTDTEVISHLVESHFDGDLVKAVEASLHEMEGSFAILAVSTIGALNVVAAQLGVPMMIGIGNGENFIASDVLALLPYTSRIVTLGDGEMAKVGDGSVELLSFDGQTIVREAECMSADVARNQGRAGFEEIFEQPDVLRHSLRGRVDAAKGVMLEYEIGPAEIFKSMKHVVIVGCGSSLHAALVGEFLIERFARLQVHVDYASQFQDRDPPLGSDTLFVAVTQSGETADTLEAMQRAREKGAFVLSICNTVGSMAARMADSALYTRSGPEFLAASTKTFTTQLLALYLLGLFLAEARGVMTPDEIRTRVRVLNRIPEQIERILDNGPLIEALAARFCEYSRAIYLGRGINFPIALEGAFKLKQNSFVHADAYPSAEIKHGPIDLVDKSTPVVVLAPHDNVYQKTRLDLEEIRARESLVLAIATEGDQVIGGRADYVVRIPEADPFSNPFLTIVPLQLFACYTATPERRARVTPLSCLITHPNS